MLIALLSLEAAAAPVHAKFDWTPGDAWNIAFERHTVRTGGGTPKQETRVTSRWTATVAGAPGALELRASDYTLDPPWGFPANDLSGAYTAAIFAAAPSFRIQPSGDVGELLDLDGMRAASDKVLEGNNFLTPQARAQIRTMMPDAQIASVVTDWWSGLVSAWIDAEMEEGQSVNTQLSAPMPMLGNLQVALNVTFTYVGPAPCVPGGPATCEVFEVRSAPDPTGLTDAIAAYTNEIAKAQGEDPGMRVTSLTTDNTTRLLTEADDLRPRSLVTERLIRMSGEANRQPYEVEQKETRTWTFTPVGEAANAPPTEPASEPADKPKKKKKKKKKKKAP